MSADPETRIVQESEADEPTPLSDDDATPVSDFDHGNPGSVEDVDLSCEVGALAFGKLAQQIAAGAFEVPVLPAVAMEVSALVRDPEVEMSRIAKTVIGDQSLCANLLRAANSVYFRRGTAVDSIPAALSRLGLAAVRDLVVGIALRDRVFRPGPFQDVIEDLWKHAQRVAGATRFFPSPGAADADGAYLCGLLHDVGKPLLLTKVLEIQRLEDLEDRIVRRSLPVIFETYHAEIADKAAAKWQFPESVRVALRCHHHPEPSSSLAVWHVHFADCLAMAYETRPGATAEELAREARLERLGLSPAETSSVVERVLLAWSEEQPLH